MNYESVNLQCRVESRSEGAKTQGEQRMMVPVIIDSRFCSDDWCAKSS